jgi:hypothetical protein
MAYNGFCSHTLRNWCEEWGFCKPSDAHLLFVCAAGARVGTFSKAGQDRVYLSHARAVFLRGWPWVRENEHK